MNAVRVKNRDAMSKLFSIIIPVHNREKYIKDTLRSVVGQDYRPIQLILVDNNSEDISIPEAKKYLSQYEDEKFIVTYTTENRLINHICRSG